MHEFMPFVDDDEARQMAAERFVSWLESQVVQEARGDQYFTSNGDPTERFWLGRLGPKDFVTLPDERGDRLEPCAIGLRIRPAHPGPWTVSATIRSAVWKRLRSDNTPGQRWRWEKTVLPPVLLDLFIPDSPQEAIHGVEQFQHVFASIGADGLAAEVRTKVQIRAGELKAIDITLVNTGREIAEFGDGRLFECGLEISGIQRTPFTLEALPDSFRFDRKVEAFGINCGVSTDGDLIRISDSPSTSKKRPRYWSLAQPIPDLDFDRLSDDPDTSVAQLVDAFGAWSQDQWSNQALDSRARTEGWTCEMRNEAAKAAEKAMEELARIRSGQLLLTEHPILRRAFRLMNRSMSRASRGRYTRWRPFQLAFLLANLRCLIEAEEERNIVDVVWFATGGGKTETYLGLLVTAAFLDRLRGKLSGVTAWSRFPLRMLSLQQTQRFANAIAAAEVVRAEEQIPGDPFSLGFLVGPATPNRILKDATADGISADELDDRINPYLLLEQCPFCRRRGVTTRFDRVSWRLLHECRNPHCSNQGAPLPLHIVDDEIWRFLPTIVIGTLDKAANIARQSGMRGIVGPPWGLCPKAGHGFTYAPRKQFPHGCLVPDCPGGAPLPLPFDSSLFAPSFRLQDELHLLRDSLGAVDAHYESALDSLQQSLSGLKPKILASSATLSGYEKQIDVLYRRAARVFPQPPPREGCGFWTSDSSQLMRRYIALAPRRLTVEFAADRLIVTLQTAIRRLIEDGAGLCSALGIDIGYSDFLVSVYGTTVVYGNTLQDIDAVVRSSETLSPPLKVATLTGATDFETVRRTLDRLENPEEQFDDRLHLVAASSMMSHGVDINRLNVMVLLAFPLAVAEFIQATARVGRQWPALVIVIPKMNRERDASLYRSFPEFVLHGDRFIEPIPITRRSRRVLERTLPGLEMAQLVQLHEPELARSLALRRDLNQALAVDPQLLSHDKTRLAEALGISDEDEFLKNQLQSSFEGFRRNLAEPTSDSNFVSDLFPTGKPMKSLRDVEEQVYIKGDSEQ